MISGCLANLYLWDARGVCLDERLPAIHHDSIKGLSIFDVAEGDHPMIEESWELAMSGESSNWIDDCDRSRGSILAGFLPIVPLRGMTPSRILGFSIPLGRADMDFIM